MLNVLMAPANIVCNCLSLEDEGDRGMVRMLVNGLILTSVGVWFVFAYFGG